MKSILYFFLVAIMCLLESSILAAESVTTIRWGFDTEQSTSFTTHGDVVRDQPGPRPPEFPDFSKDNTAIKLTGRGSRIVIKDPGPRSLFDFTNGDAITIEAWVNIDQLRTGEPAYVIGKGRTHSPHFSKENQNWSLRVQGAKEESAHLSFLFTSKDGSKKPEWHRWTSEGAFRISDGWHHIAVAYDFGKPESIRGWIDGQPTKGKWDLSGPTKIAPVVDNDDVWIGSSLNGSASNSFRGLLDEVIIHRKALNNAQIAKHFHRKDGPRVILPLKPMMPDLKVIESDKVLVQFCEGLPTYKRWPNSTEKFPSETDRWLGESFLLPRVPIKYDSWGIRSSWKPPLLVRMAADVDLPTGKHRFLLRTRALARLWIDGKLVAQTKPAIASSPNGHDAVTPLAKPPHPGVRVKDYHQQEVFGTLLIPKKKAPSRVVLEVVAGGKSQRTEIGEICVAIESPNKDSFSVLRPVGKPELPLTDTHVEPVLAHIKNSLDTFDDENRRRASRSRDAFWNKRHTIAKQWVKTNPRPSPLRSGHPIDAFIDKKIEKALIASSSPSKNATEFHENVLPILRNECFRCHGEKEKGGLKLNSRQAALKGGESEVPAIVPGDPRASELIERIRAVDEDLVMPPTGTPLSKKQITTLETWIRDGAKWPDPPIDSKSLTRTPITSDEVFLRRIYLDTIGVPPTVDEAQLFLQDKSPEKRTRLIDRLLTDERYADHQMGEWLDLLAENPTLINPSLNSTGPFRWFLYEAFRDDKAIDRMVTELLLMRGDSAHGGSAGFGLAAENDAPFAAKGHIIASVFLGIELQCARCHDSPYHSTTQRDLFSLAAMFERKSVTVPKTSRVPAGFFEKKGRESLIQVTLKPDEQVTPTWPFTDSTGVKDDSNLNALIENPKDSRERLAALVTSPENHRFSQVLVNRVWKRLLGSGLVEPAHDWEGRKASHPKLLNWLASELLSNNYNLKHIVRLITTSKAYQRVTSDQKMVANGSQYQFFNAPLQRRLTAEQIVDSLHVAAGATIDSEEMTFVHDGRHPLGRRQTLGIPRRSWMFATLNNERDRPSLALPRAQMTVNVLKAFGWNGSRQKPILSRDYDPNVLQPGILANGLLTQSLSRASHKSELAKLAIDAQSPDKLLDSLFLRFLVRYPRDSERDSFLPALQSGYANRMVPLDKIVDPISPKPLPLATWLNHVTPEANSIQLEIEKRVQVGPAPDPRLRPQWRRVYEDIIWSLINHREFVWIP